MNKKKELLKKLLKYNTSIISDAMNKMNSMHAEIKPIQQNIHVAGTAFTVKSISGGNYGSHIALYEAQNSDILVIDARGDINTAVWGGVQTKVALQKGIRAVIIDGSIRDVREIRESKLPVFCKGIIPNGPHKGWKDEYNLPISCGGVPVNPGDYIVADDDGVVVIPKDRITEILEKAEKNLQNEKEWFARMKKGEKLYEILGLKKR